MTEAETQEIAEDVVVMPLTAETMTLGKETVVTGGVRVSTRVTEHVETADLPLRREEFIVERVPIHRQVSEVPQPYQDGDSWVMPVVEEVLVVEKRLMLKEEVRVRRTSTEVHSPVAVTLRTEEAVIEEMAPEDASLRA